MQLLIDALSLGSIYACVALGIALIFGVMRLVNLAHGELLMITGYSMVVLTAVPLGLRVVIAIVITALAAVAMDQIGFRFARGASEATLMVISFGLSFLLQNIAILVFGSEAKSLTLPAWVGETINIGTLQISVIDIVTIVVSAGMLIAVSLIIQRTFIGREMRAAAEDFAMARLLGVNSNRVIATAFAIAGVLASIAGLMLVASTAVVTPTMGLPMLLAGVVATTIGGSGDLKASVMGAYLFGAISTLMQSWLPSNLVNFRDAFAFILIIALLVLRPQGLFVRRTTLERV